MNCVLITGDEQQNKKAKEFHLDSYYFRDDSDRKRLTALIMRLSKNSDVDK